MKRAYFQSRAAAERFYAAIPVMYNAHMCTMVLSTCKGHVVSWEDDYEENYLWGY